ncbi:MAG: hypothetical protein R6U70_10145 [Bacillota bacterium]
MMEVLSYLAPVAFVFAIGAYSLAANLKKEVQELREEVNALRSQQ